MTLGHLPGSERQRADAGSSPTSRQTAGRQRHYCLPISVPLRWPQGVAIVSKIAPLVSLANSLPYDCAIAHKAPRVSTNGNGVVVAVTPCQVEGVKCHQQCMVGWKSVDDSAPEPKAGEVHCHHGCLHRGCLANCCRRWLGNVSSQPGFRHVAGCQRGD